MRLAAKLQTVLESQILTRFMDFQDQCCLDFWEQRWCPAPMIRDMFGVLFIGFNL